MNKKQLSLLASYIIGAFITNSYCRNCRWGDWKGPDWTEKHIIWADRSCNEQKEIEVERKADAVGAFFMTSGATILWPIYAASRICDAGVSYASNIELKWK